MFEQLQMAPPDPILGLTEAFKQDSNPNKVNLGVGVYKDQDGQTPVLESVKKAEQIMLEKDTSKSYLPIPGAPEYGAAVQKLLFGDTHEIIADKRACTAHCPGGTGALRVAGEFLHGVAGARTLWVSNPTWANHRNIFTAAGFDISEYPYYDAENKSLNASAMLQAIAGMSAGDVILLHGGCHNPSGMDPTVDQWRQIALALHKQRVLPLIDFAYQGFAQGIDEDATGLRLVCSECSEVVIASSFSKNFGLYKERTGAMTMVAASNEQALTAFSHAKKLIRCNYSNPPAHGGMIVTTILEDAGLTGLWESEVATMRDRINETRADFVKTLSAKGLDDDWSYITSQNGMFSFVPLSKPQIETLRNKYSIYIVGSGRINVAGITPRNIDYLCDAIIDVFNK